MVEADVGRAREKYRRLIAVIAGQGSVAVAFSGGVDSSFLCHCAVSALGDKCIACTVVSPMLPQSELEDAKKIAAHTGIRHILIHEERLDDDVAANPKDRCYHCKKNEFGAILKTALEQGIQTVFDGSNMDDTGDYRPGLRAVAELRVRSPLREVGLHKAEIRLLSREAGLPTWDKPAYACLASRIPYGERLDTAKLARVEKAEAYLRSLGLRQFRVRSHGDIGRIEAAPEERSLFFNTATLDEVSARLKSFGFLFVALELEGYRMGSLNAVLERAAD
jgi:uncharacterized protein